MNKQMIMNLASKFLPQEKVNRLSQAFDSANSIMSMANNPQEALSKAGVTKQDLDSIENLLQNPMAGFVLNSLGVNKTEALQVINQLKGNSITEQSPVAELEDLEKALRSIK